MKQEDALIKAISLLKKSKNYIPVLSDNELRKEIDQFLQSQPQEPPIGDFILKQKDIVPLQDINGSYYHYSEVCTLLNRYKENLSSPINVDQLQKENDMYCEREIVFENRIKYLESVIEGLSAPKLNVEEAAEADWVKRYEELRRTLNMVDSITKLASEIKEWQSLQSSK